MLNNLFRKNTIGKIPGIIERKKGSIFLVLLLGFTSALMVSSCNKVKEPYLKKPDPVIPTGDTIRKVLFEDYTGHRCSNCPRVANYIHTFQSTFPKQIIALATHSKFAGTFTVPDASHPADFRTAVGDKYFKDFLVQGLPAGIINRRNKAAGYNSGAESKWEDSLRAILSKAPDAILKITNTYDTTLRKLTSSIKCNFLNNLQGTYNLVVLLTQDNIVSPQDNSSSTNYPPYASPVATNYKHMHVLRDCIDGSGGTGVPIGSITKGNSVTKSFTLDPLPMTYGNISVDPKNCNVVAFICNSTTNEVVQAEEAKLK